MVSEKKKKKNTVLIFFCLLLSGFLMIPLVMYILWIIQPSKPLDIIIIDKTVLTPEAPEHASFTWFLRNRKVVKKENSELYTTGDYYGFFPEEEKKFIVKDFEKHQDSSLIAVAEKNDVLYITDTYGIYSNEWYGKQEVLERSAIVYGGLTEKELELLKEFKSRKKLILSEFNCIGSPTSKPVRTEFENLFGIEWTGWTGRYFDSFLETNEELPHWLVKNYKAQHNDQWPFTDSGIAFVNENGQVEILENGTDLTEDVPAIYTSRKNAERFNLPRKIKYPYWFDILRTEDFNNPVSLYHISTNARGDSIMKRNGILKTFPAVIEHSDENYKFYYFSGDFADNTISQKYYQLKGFHHFKSLLASSEKTSRGSFFWNYYYPLMTEIFGY